MEICLEENKIRVEESEICVEENDLILSKINHNGNICRRKRLDKNPHSDIMKFNL